MGLLITIFTSQTQAQVNYNGCSVTGTYASAIGKNNTASGNNSFAGGYGSQSLGSNSFAFGYNSKASQSTTTAVGNTAIASGAGSLAIGNYVKATAQNSFVIGSGTAATSPLTNSTDNSIAFGINSNKPTLLITKSLNNNYTGKVAIGQVPNPQAKLHIKSDNNEDAGVFIEPSNTNAYKAFIKLFDNSHGITVDKTSVMELNAGIGPLHFKGESYHFVTTGARTARLYTSGIPSFYVNTTRNGNTETRDGEGNSFAIDFADNALTIRTAAYQNPRGSEITNWENLITASPQTMDLQSDQITLLGKVGINTSNNVNGYALAVDGGIISTKVFIKEVKQWPDYVFFDNYALMGWDELKQYLSENHHLPGVPSEKEILNQGYDLNDMQSVMMEKIEELTRYLLLLQAEVEELKTKPNASTDSIVFTYDSNGNRIARSLWFERVAIPGDATRNTSPLSYNLFPNPTSGMFSILIKEQSQDVTLHATLLTLNGVVIDEKVLETNQVTFDLSGQPSGIYLLEIEGPEGHQSWKVIKR